MRPFVIAAALALATPAFAHHDADWTPLLAPEAAAEMAEHRDAVLLDIRAPEDYAAGHVEGALNAPYPTWRGPAENPGAVLTNDALTERLQSLGLTPESAVIITYQGKDPTDFGAAARVYWTLKSAGLTRLAILNGGIAAWNGAGLALSTEPATAPRSTDTFTLADTWMMDREGVQAVIDGRSDAVLVDARPHEFFTGDKAHRAARRPGTLSGSVNLSYADWFAGEAPELRPEVPVLDRLLSLGADPGPVGDRPIVSFCNTGHWAATNWFMLSEIAGIEGVKLYPESMVGWTGAEGAVINGGS